MSVGPHTLFKLLVWALTFLTADVAMARSLREHRKAVTMRGGGISSTISPRDMEAAETPQTIMKRQLVQLGERFADMNYVPYIWGGEQIGTKAECDACRACAMQAKTRLDKRLARCDACKRCGIDCSHFVHRLYKTIGLNYQYATTRELTRIDHKQLLRHYNMIDVGTSLSDAQPGDLLLYKKHVAMVLRVRDDQHADFVHASRFRAGDRHKLGGLRLDMNQNVYRFRGELVRILRHQFLHDGQASMAVNRSAVSLTPFSIPRRQLMYEWANPG